MGKPGSERRSRQVRIGRWPCPWHSHIKKGNQRTLKDLKAILRYLSSWESLRFQSQEHSMWKSKNIFICISYHFFLSYGYFKSINQIEKCNWTSLYPLPSFSNSQYLVFHLFFPPYSYLHHLLKCFGTNPEYHFIGTFFNVYL